MNQELLESVKDVLVAELEDTAEMCRRLSDGDPLPDGLQDKFSELRGVFSLLVMPGAEVLSSELSSALPCLGEMAEKRQTAIEQITTALAVMTRYFLHVVAEGVDTPLLLAPEVNAIRALQGKPILDDSAFLSSHLPDRPFVLSMVTRSGQQQQVIVRSRQLYQKGLLHLIRGQSAQPSLRVMYYAVTLIAKSMEPGGEQLYWQLAASLLEAFALRKLALTKPRIRLLMVLERQMAALAKTSDDNPQKYYPAGNQRSLLACLMLLDKVNDRDQRLAEQLGIDTRLYSDREINRIRARLHPDQNVNFADRLDALEDSLRDLRVLLDEKQMSAGNGKSETGLMHDLLQKIAGETAEMGLSRPQANFARHLQDLDDSGFSAGMLQSIVDSVLHLECVLLQLDGVAPTEKQLREINEQSTTALVERNISAHAQRLALRGAVHALSDIMQVISDYAADLIGAEELSGQREKFDVVIGVTAVLHLDRAKKVAQRCKEMLSSPLEQVHVSGDVFMDTLADTLASLEFYLSSRSRSANADEDVLNLAEECLQLISPEVPELLER